MVTEKWVEVIDLTRKKMAEAGVDIVLNLTTSGGKFPEDMRQAHLPILLPEMITSPLHACRFFGGAYTEKLAGGTFAALLPNTGAGFASGLRSTYNSVLSAAASLASAAISKLRSALSIHSPSRLWKLSLFIWGRG